MIRKGSKGVGGREAAVSPDVMKALSARAQERDTSKNSYTSASFRVDLEEERKLDAASRGRNTMMVAPLAPSTFRRYRGKILPAKVRRAASQNERRFEALMDVQNHVGLAALWKAVIETPQEGEELPPSRMFNFDSTSILLETSAEDANTLYMAEGSRARLRELGLSPAKTNTRRTGRYKKRCVQLTVLNRADGTMCCAVVTIKDRIFTSTQRHMVSVKDLLPPHNLFRSPLACMSFLQCKRPPALNYDIYVITTPARSKGSRQQPGDGEEDGDIEGEDVEDLLEDLNLETEHGEDITRLFAEAEAAGAPGVAASTSSSGSSSGPSAAPSGPASAPVAADAASGPAAAPAPAVAAASTSTSTSTASTTHEAQTAQLTVSALAKAARSFVEQNLRAHFTIERQAATASQSQSSATSPEDEKEIEERIAEAMKTVRYIITFDGEQFQMEAIVKLGGDTRYIRLERFKLPAMCSAFTQPSDKMVGFKMVKAMQKKVNGEVTSIYVHNEKTAYVSSCEQIVACLEASSRRTFLKFLLHLPRYLSSAYTTERVMDGWHKTGLYPYSASKMLSYWPKFKDITDANANGLMGAIDALAIIAGQQGYLPDETIRAHILAFLPPECLPNQREKPLEDYPLNRWRATWLNAPGTIARWRKRLADKAAEAAAKAVRATNKRKSSEASSSGGKGGKGEKNSRGGGKGNASVTGRAGRK